MSFSVAEEPVSDALHHKHQVLRDERVEVRTGRLQQLVLARRAMEALGDIMRHVGGRFVETARQFVGRVVTVDVSSFGSYLLTCLSIGN